MKDKFAEILFIRKTLHYSNTSRGLNQGDNSKINYRYFIYTLTFIPVRASVF